MDTDLVVTAAVDVLAVMRTLPPLLADVCKDQLDLKSLRLVSKEGCRLAMLVYVKHTLTLHNWSSSTVLRVISMISSMKSNARFLRTARVRTLHVSLGFTGNSLQVMMRKLVRVHVSYISDISPQCL